MTDLHISKNRVEEWLDKVIQAKKEYADKMKEIGRLHYDNEDELIDWAKKNDIELSMKGFTYNIDTGFSSEEICVRNILNVAEVLGIAPVLDRSFDDGTKLYNFKYKDVKISGYEWNKKAAKT